MVFLCDLRPSMSSPLNLQSLAGLNTSHHYLTQVHLEYVPAQLPNLLTTTFVIMMKRSGLYSAMIGACCLLIGRTDACLSPNILDVRTMYYYQMGSVDDSRISAATCSITDKESMHTQSIQDAILEDGMEVGNAIPHSLYEIIPIPGKGLGLVATTKIPAGTKILVEKPLFSVALPEMVAGQGFRIGDMVADIEKGFNQLSLDQQEEFLALHDHRFPDENQSNLLTILRSNGYNTGENQVGVFPKIARINHSCTPNCGNFWSEKAGHRVIYTESDILEGEEITVSYIPLLKSNKERHARLQQYGFVCDCSACQSAESSKRRTKIHDMLESLEQKLHASSKKAETNDRLIKKSTRLIELVEEEGLTNYLAKALHLASIFNQRRGNLEAAMEWATKELQIHQWAEVDSEEALTTTRYMEALMNGNMEDYDFV